MTQILSAVAVMGCVLVCYWLLANRIDLMQDFLSGLSDDINEMKEKLGLSIEPRTLRQKETRDKKFIREEIFNGRSKRELREKLGEELFGQYRSWIDYCAEEYAKAHPGQA